MNDAQPQLPKPVLAQVRAILNKDADADRMALFWPDPITPADMVQRVDETELRFVYCPSELAMRELLVSHRPGGRRLVLLTPFDERRLAKDVLARLWGQAPKRISAWRTLEQLLQLREIDPRLTAKESRWIGECLLEQYDRYRERIQFGDVLDVELAWRALATALLDLSCESVDLDVLLDWSRRPDAAALVAALPAPVEQHLEDWLRPKLGDQVQVVLALWRQGQAGAILAIGLVCDLLYGHDRRLPRQAMHALLLARGRFSERLLGGAALPESILARFGNAAVAHLQRSLAVNPRQGVGPILDAAEQLLASLDLSAVAVASDLLPAGYALRLEAFAAALKQAVGGESVAPASAALATLEGHRLAGAREQQLETARMAVRACRWLTTEASADARPGAIIRDYVANGGWLDWARSKLWRGDAHEPLSRVYQRLSARLAERREAFNQRFSEYLPAIARGDRMADWAVPIEAALSERVAPLARERPVLLVVLDGMSQAVYRELADDLLRHHWVEMQLVEAAAETCLLAALPTVTRLSRFALLSGSLGEGVSGDEKRAFEAHAALKGVSTAKAPPRLFHKADLQEPGSGALAGSVRAAIASEHPRVIGVVINVIDDQLSSNAQLGVPWSLSSVAVLRQMLEAAKESRRLAILTSDHGHVLDHAMRLVPTATEAERYRSPGDAPAPEEVLLRGPRVALPEHEVVLPWSEQLRYGSQKMGYHGGGAPQEVLVPFGVFRSTGDAEPVAGWQEVPRREPAWWLQGAEPPVVGQSAEDVAPSTKRNAAPATAQLALDLAGGKDATRDDTSADADWIDALLASPVYGRMKGRGGRVPIADEQLRRLLALLAQGGGQQMTDPLARGLGIPVIRLPGFLAGVQKLLNVDGYPVLSVDRVSKTVKLDIASLRAQFEIAG